MSGGNAKKNARRAEADRRRREIRIRAGQEMLRRRTGSPTIVSTSESVGSALVVGGSPT